MPRQLPSPADLKYKIIIKNKKCKTSRKFSSTELAGCACKLAHIQLSSDPIDSVPIAYDEANEEEEIVIDGEVEAENEEDVRRRKERSKEIAKELSDLVNYCTPFHFQVRPRWN